MWHLLQCGCRLLADVLLRTHALLQFVVETKPTGNERELTEGRTSEYLSTEEKIVEVTKPNPCGGVPTS